MSHAATNWAIQQRGMKPATKILLWHLADRHNKDTKRCDPSQALLAHDAEMSEATVNRHIDKLEEMRLVRRVPRWCPRTKRQLTTMYELAFDHDLSVVDDEGGPVSQNERRPDPQNESRAVSQKSQQPSLKNAESRLSNCETNPVREPGKEPCASAQTNDLPDDFVDRFFAVYPRAGDREKTEASLTKAVCQDGASCDAILAGAKAYAAEQKGTPPRYIAYSENWVDKKRWLQFAATKKSVSPDVILEQRAKAIRGGQSWVGRYVSAASAREMVSRGLVTVEQCRAAGVAL